MADHTESQDQRQGAQCAGAESLDLSLLPSRANSTRERGPRPRINVSTPPPGAPAPPGGGRPTGGPSGEGHQQGRGPDVRRRSHAECVWDWEYVRRAPALMPAAEPSPAPPRIRAPWTPGGAPGSQREARPAFGPCGRQARPSHAEQPPPPCPRPQSGQAELPPRSGFSI